MVDYPSSARFLTERERSFIIQRRGAYQLGMMSPLLSRLICTSGIVKHAAQDEERHISKQVWAACTDWQVWALSVVELSVVTPGRHSGNACDV